MARSLLVFFLAVCLYGASLIAFRAFSQRIPTKFSLAAISSSREFHPEWEHRALLPEELHLCNLALAQSYTYLAQGGQSFVFLSSDGLYVIKFFKQALYNSPRWLRFLPPYLFRKYCSKKQAKSQDKLARDFRSYQLAFDQLAESTAVLLPHLNSSSHLRHILSLFDEEGQEYQIDLDQVSFLLQKRAHPLLPLLTTLEQAGAYEEARKVFKGVLTLINACHQRGIFDRDPELPANCGWIDGRAVKMDVGRFMPLADGTDAQALSTYAYHTLEREIAIQCPSLLPLYFQVQREQP